MSAFGQATAGATAVVLFANTAGPNFRATLRNCHATDPVAIGPANVSATTGFLLGPNACLVNIPITGGETWYVRRTGLTDAVVSWMLSPC